VDALGAACVSPSCGGAAAAALALFLPDALIELLLALEPPTPALAHDAGHGGAAGWEKATRPATRGSAAAAPPPPPALELLAPSPGAVSVVAWLERDHATPDLQWTAAHRREVRRRVAEVTKARQLQSGNSNSNGSSSFWRLADTFGARFGSGGGYGGGSSSRLVCGGVDVALFLGDPGFELRDPEKFFRALLDTFWQASHPDAEVSPCSAKRAGGLLGGDADTSDDEGPVGGAGGARAAAAATARASRLCARAVAALLHHSPDALLLQACAASLKLVGRLV
jgi:hypothetical protein